VARGLTPFLFEDGVMDPLAQRLRDVVFAPVGDHLAEVGLEVEGPETRGAFVEMLTDLRATSVGELTVEIVIEPFDRVVAIDLGLFRTHLALSHQARG
jgi:hypothetical protein